MKMGSVTERLPGIGQRLQEKLIKELGSEEELLSVLENQELHRIAEIPGVGPRRARSIVASYLGVDIRSLLATDRGIKVYESILERIQSYTATEVGHNSVGLLLPVSDKKRIANTTKFVMKAKERISNLDVESLRKCLKKIKPLESKKPGFVHDRIILVETQSDARRLQERGLDRYCQITSPEEAGDFDQGCLLVYAYSEGNLDMSGIDNAVISSIGCKDVELVPELLLDTLSANTVSLRNTLALREMLGLRSCIAGVIGRLDDLRSSEISEDELEQAACDAVAHINHRLKEESSGLRLEGEEVLEVLGKAPPGSVSEILDSVREEGRAIMKERTGIDAAPFTRGYPIEIDQSELERLKHKLVAKLSQELFEAKVRVAKDLGELLPDLEKEVKESLSFDYEQALGSFALDYDLHPVQLVELGEGLSFKDGLHLDLARDPSAVPVSYSLGGGGKDGDKVALLTGANSGGKTTLLETIAQIQIMTHMGLPVRAKEARVELFEEVYLFGQKRNLDAGAFESFLKGLVSLVTTSSRKLVLADELEAMTEPEAAARIITAFIALLQESDSYAVIVTHMAPWITRSCEVRVDGIEARGLDESFSLVVDRTPHIGHLARSTPELIVKKLLETSKGETKEVYEKIWERFKKKDGAHN